ncbi:MAG: glycosyltransferase [Lachnospiraceae bacterium]|nr:glycosyltransferase [Lachnospiraceae bacterium]
MKKKILFVIRELAGGGAERALSNITMNFPDDWEIDLLMNNRDFIEFPYRGNLLSLDIPEPGSRKSVVHQIWAIIKRIWYLRRLKRENQYDACISFLDSSNISNVLSGNKYCKTIISMRLSMTSEKSGLLYRISAVPLMKLVYNHANKIVAVSKEIEQVAKVRFHIPDKQITTIVNGYDVTKIMAQAQKKPENAITFDGKRLIVTVGRLDSQKGQWHLIRAFAEVAEKEPDAVLCVIGSGDCESYLKKLIRLNNLEKQVFLLGYSKNPFWYDAQAEIFVLPSMYEGFPNSLAEAVCCGVPCIATDFHSGAREILAPDMDIMGAQITEITEAAYGLLTPLCSGTMYKGTEPLEVEERKLAEAILILLRDEEKMQYYREQSRKRREMLGIQAVVRDWIRVIEEE